MKKLVIVINGRGGSGKDTFCGIVAKKYPVRNISTITPIKEIARCGGWNGEKDAASRSMLARLKEVFTEYNELPNTYALDEYKNFLGGTELVMFVHIREKREIEKFVAGVKGGCRTLLVTRPGESDSWGNDSDDLAESLDYDYRYVNDKPLEKLEEDVLKFFGELLRKEDAGPAG